MFFSKKELKLYGEGVLRHPLLTPGLYLVFFEKNQNLLFFATKEPNIIGEGTLRRTLSTPGSRLH